MKPKNQPEPSLSFVKGFKLLNDYEKEICKREIMAALSITTDQGFGKRKNGKVRHDVISAARIEEIFAKFGVKPKDVWGS